MGYELTAHGAVMPFVSVPGLNGKVYVPEEIREGSKKHPCRDCFSCQECSDDRCRVCLGLRKCSCSKQPKSKTKNAVLNEQPRRPEQRDPRFASTSDGVSNGKFKTPQGAGN